MEQNKNTPIKEKGKEKHAHTRLNGKIEKRDLGMEGGEETLRAHARRVLRRCALWCVFFCVVLCFCRFFVVLLWQKLNIVVIHKNKNGKLRCET